MNLFRDVPGSFHHDDVEAAQALADMAAIAIISRRQYDAAQVRARQLQGALDSRIVIEQAKGIMAERHGLPPADAFEAIRSHARRHQRTVRDISRDIVDGALRLDLP